MLRLMCRIKYIERDSLSHSSLAVGNDVVKKGQMRDTSKRITNRMRTVHVFASRISLLSSALSRHSRIEERNIWNLMSCLMCRIKYIERDSLSRSSLAVGNDVVELECHLSLIFVPKSFRICFLSFRIPPLESCI